MATASVIAFPSEETFTAANVPRVNPDVRGGNVLAVDDCSANLGLLVQVLERDSHLVRCAHDAASALVAIGAQIPDVVVLDVCLPDGDGFEVCRRLKENPRTRLTPVIMTTGFNSREHRLKGIQAGADDFVGKPFDAAELRARVRSLIRMKRYTDELESAQSVIISLALTVEARDAYTDGHCQRLAHYSRALGVRLGLSGDEVDALEGGAYLHDVGKIGIPDAILHKQSSLTPSEFEIMKQHTVIGDRLCGSLRSLALVRSIVRHHHERLDGSGYPDGLSQDQIPLLAQIVSITDTYDAITTDRPYRAPQSPETAFRELRADAAKGLVRADLVEAFIDVGRRGALSCPLHNLSQLMRSRESA